MIRSMISQFSLLIYALFSSHLHVLGRFSPYSLRSPPRGTPKDEESKKIKTGTTRQMITSTSTTTTTNNRRRKTRLLNPELCASESLELCNEMDNLMIDQSQRTRKLIESTGNLRTLVLLLEFQDHRRDDSRTIIDPDDINTFFNADDDQINTDNAHIIPTGSVKSYLQKNSYGKLDIEATVIPWFTVPQNETDCTFDNSGLDRRFQQCVWPILEALDILHADSTHEFDWRDYDNNGDEFLDSVVVMTSSYGAEYGGRNSTQRIWSHSIGPQSERWTSQYYDISLGGYCVTSAYSGTQGSTVARLGLVVHEILHLFGIPDLFDTHRNDQRGGVGSYSIMSNAWGPGPVGDATLPGSLDPWSKIQLGWLTPKPIQNIGNYAMKPSALEPDVYAIGQPYFPEGEYLLLENRQPIEYDKNLWGDGGVLIWHIDDSAGEEYNSQAGGSYQIGWPQNGNHYRVAVVQADGRFELERGINQGDSFDFFGSGTTNQLYLGPGFNSTIFPNTDSYQNGIVMETNITLSTFVQFGQSIHFVFDELKRQDDTSGCSGKHHHHHGSQPPPETKLPIRVVRPQPTLDENGCLIRVNTQLCSYHRERILTLNQEEEDCQCYNLCGNGIGQSCCKFGESCHINCHSGGLIAGCTNENINDDENENPELLFSIDKGDEDGDGVGAGILVEIRDGSEDEGCDEEEHDTDQDGKDSASSGRGASKYVLAMVSIFYTVIYSIFE